MEDKPEFPTGLPVKGILMLMSLPVIVTLIAFASLLTTDVSDLAIGTPLVITPTPFVENNLFLVEDLSNIEEVYKAGLEAFENGDYRGAVSAFQTVLEIAPEAAVVHTSLGLALVQMGELEAAAAAFEIAASLDARDPVAQYNLAIANAALERYSEAEKAFLATLSQDPDLAPAAYGLAGVYRATGRVKDAIKAYQLAVDIDPGFTEAYLELGLLFAEIQEWSKAEDALETALNTKPGSLEIQFNLGVVYVERGDLRMARLLFSAVMAKDAGGEWGHRAAEAQALLDNSGE